jgi:FdhE protein
VTEETDGKILQRLAELERDEGGFPPLLRFYRDLLAVQVEARRRMGPPDVGLDAGVINDRLRRGVPLLGCEDLLAAAAPAIAFYASIRDIFCRYPELFPGLAGPTGGRSLTGEAIRAWFNGRAMPASFVDGAGDRTARAMVGSGLRPLLAALAESLAPGIDTEQWRRPFCPVCGGLPDMACLDKERGARRLVCSRCDFTWPFQRLRCPYCGTEEQTALAFFVDDRGLYRLDVCERCKCYLKTIDLRNAAEELLLPLERLLTADLDRQALEEGYRLPG